VVLSVTLVTLLEASRGTVYSAQVCAATILGEKSNSACGIFPMRTDVLTGNIRPQGNH